MNLWIRSQNKEQLLKPNKLYVKILNEERYEILSGEGFYVLGTYKTKERALEVLDEIQEVLMPKIKVLQSVNAENNIDGLVSRPTIQECGKVELLQYSDYVYEMPKEWL